MLHKSLVVLLVFVILSTSFTKLFMYAGYEMNKDYIAKVLCENKDKPIMNCKGKCYLSKKLKEAEQADQKQEKSNSKQYVPDNFLMTTFRFKSYIRLTATYLTAKTHPYFSLRANAIFHPPKAV